MFSRRNSAAGVFSAHAEVVPTLLDRILAIIGILRARGGSSFYRNGLSIAFVYSPRTRR